jgi:hypothetical protein
MYLIILAASLFSLERVSILWTMDYLPSKQALILKKASDSRRPMPDFLLMPDALPAVALA